MSLIRILLLGFVAMILLVSCGSDSPLREEDCDEPAEVSQDAGSSERAAADTGPVTSESSQDPKEIEEYWTKERMDSAEPIPMPHPTGEGGLGDGTPPGDSGGTDGKPPASGDEPATSDTSDC